MERKGTTRKDTRRDNAGARTIQGWEALVKTTASKIVPGRKEVDGMYVIDH